MVCISDLVSSKLVAPLTLTYDAEVVFIDSSTECPCDGLVNMFLAYYQFF